MTIPHGRQLPRRLRAFARDVSGDSAKALVATLVAHLGVVREGLALAEKTIHGIDPNARTDEEIESIEHRGDQLRQQLVAGLARTLVTPLDREDLFRLSRSIDDVLDNTRDFIREWSLYGPTRERQLGALLEALGSGVEELRAAVTEIGSRTDRASAHLLTAKHMTNRVRRRFEEEIADLLAGEVTPEVLKHRELLRRLDVVGLRLGEAIDTLFDGFVKRGAGLSMQWKDTSRR